MVEDYKGCSFCKHYQQDGSCAAYPKGIPMAFISGIKHLKVFKDQTGDTIYEYGGFLINVKPE